MELILIALILGVVEGLTEFIPVSSTGHLIIVGHFLGFNSLSAQSFEIFIQLGAILAALFLYLDRFRDLFRFDTPNQTVSLSGKAGLAKVTLAILPALIGGALLHSVIKKLLFSPLFVAIGLIIGGIIFLLVERRKGRAYMCSVEEISYRSAILIGIAQCFSLWPGISRSGSTIVGAMLCGVDRRSAAEFSFIIAVPVLLAAVSYDMIKSWDTIPADMIVPFLIGAVTAGIVGAFSIKALLAALGHYSLKPFGYYRIVLGLVIYYLFA